MQRKIKYFNLMIKKINFLAKNIWMKNIYKL